VLFTLTTTAGQSADVRPAEHAVPATVSSTLPTAGDHIRQYAFDGKPATYFLSDRNVAKNDSFTLTFDRPVAIDSVAVTTGRPDSSDKLDAGRLEGSLDGKTFKPLAAFAAGNAEARPKSQRLRAVRVLALADSQHPLAIREFAIQSNPPVAIFKYPVEVVVDVSDAPEMKAWADKVARICERAYPMINDELKSPGYVPAHLIHMRLSKRYRGVAATGGTRIIGSVSYFKAHPRDVGAMVHETVHVVQRYRHGHAPGWLVEGIADYVRFFKFEPGKLGARINPRTARYNRSYRVTAAFLAYVTRKYDRHLVRKVNEALREGKYTDKIFQDLTGKSLQELGAEWKASLEGGRNSE
jgi:hypothetical protein